MIKKSWIVFLLALSLILTRSVYAGTASITRPVTIEATVGKFRFVLFGYTSPYALVTINGMGIFDQTYSDKTGYFEFTNRFSPLAPREACLTSLDQFGRTTAPTCIPPFPIQYDIQIGPILIPPTISLDKGGYYQGDEIKLSGQTIPNSELAVSTFVDERRSIFSFLSYGFAKPVEAFTFPKLTAKSDDKGNFSLAFPSSHPEFFRVFAQTSFDNGISPESVRLNLKIFPIWMIIVQFLLLLFSLLRSRLLEIIILTEVIALTIFFLRRYLHPHVIAKNRALAIRELSSIVTEETSLMLSENHPLVKG